MFSLVLSFCFLIMRFLLLFLSNVSWMRLISLNQMLQFEGVDAIPKDVPQQYPFLCLDEKCLVKSALAPG